MYALETIITRGLSKITQDTENSVRQLAIARLATWTGKILTNAQMTKIVQHSNLESATHG